jgi:cardiolipin synthase
VADALSLGRLLLAPAIAVCGFAGAGRLAAALLVVAALTDVLDGRVARARGASPCGAQLDAAADAALMLATAVALTVLHPDIVSGQGVEIVAVALLYAAATALTWRTQRRLVDPRQLTAKAAGGALYAFALFTLAAGVYVPALLSVAALALAVSSLNAILNAASSSQASSNARNARSQRPHHVNVVVSSAAASTSSAAPTATSPTDTRP